METPDFLLEAPTQEAPTQDELDKLAANVASLEKVDEAITKAEEALALLKAKQLQLGGTIIPEQLLKRGLSELRLANGKKVIVKTKMNVNITEEKKPLFFAFLRKRNEDDIIKIKVAFDKMPKEKQEELFEFLNNYEFEYESDLGVHHKTQEAYFNRLLGVGKEDRVEGLKEGKYLREEAIETFASCFTFHTTTIK